MANFQTRSKHLKIPPNHPENRLFDPNFTFGVPKSHKNPGMGGFTDLGKIPPKIGFVFWGASLTSSLLLCDGTEFFMNIVNKVFRNGHVELVGCIIIGDELSSPRVCVCGY